jgi:DNA-binding response OmpR family regulator
METKSPTRTVPTLAKVALKKVAVARPGAPAAAPSGVQAAVAPRPGTEPQTIVRRVLVAEQDEGVRNAVAASLPRDRFQVWTYGDGDSAYDHLGQHGADLVILGREMPGLQGTVLCDLLRKGKNGEGLAIVLMSPRYSNPSLGAGDCGAFGADEFLPLPTTPDVLMDKVEQALVAREPVEKLKALPPALARQVDELAAKLDTLSYYELLEIPFEAERGDIQVAFHQKSLVYHPDRHARLKATVPHAFEKINTIYKRISEAYKVLSHPANRHTYNVGLRRRGAVRFEPESTRRREEKDLDLVTTAEARNFVIQAVECRGFGDLEGARTALEHALRLEPDNQALQDRIAAISKLLFIVRTQNRT